MTDAHVPLAARLNYAQCWEDGRLLGDALAIQPGQRVLSIASAGDNSFELALRGAEVVAVDLSRAQLAVCELKLAGRHLSYAHYRQLLRIDHGVSPKVLFDRVAASISRPSLEWWSAHPHILMNGVLDSGRFEAYLRLFRDRVLPLTHRRSTVLKWFQLNGLDEQRDYYKNKWNNRRWNWLFRLFFSQRVMAARGRSPEQFAHVEGAVSQLLFERAERVFTQLSLEDNGFVQWMLTGRYLSESALPRYLTQEGHARLGEIADRITWVHADLATVADSGTFGRFDGYNLSDIFEYMSLDASEKLYKTLIAVANPGARLAYWNLLVPRSCPASCLGRVQPQPKRAAELFAQDRAFVYGAFHLEVCQ